ncbi:MAG TPA: hypothetical protein VGC79_25660 [Polyangiaceae bacterium]
MGKVSIGLLGALFSSLLPTAATAEQPRVIISNSTRGHQQSAGKVPISQINREDCLTKDWFDFTLELEQYEGYALEVWAGTACDNLTARPPSSTATCWQVPSEQPQSEIFDLRVGVRDLLRGRTGGGIADEGGTSSSVPACELTSTVLAPQVLDMYMLLLDTDRSTVSSAIWRSTYKLTPPPPLHVASVQSGDRQLSVELSPLVTDQAFDGVLLFCDPAPNDANAAANAQTTTTDAGDFVASCFASTELMPGADAAGLQRLHCGNASRTTLTAVADGLVNGVSYNIAVASVDSYRNVGPLSEVACQVPQARPSNLRAEACTFSGRARKQRGSELLWLVALGAAVSSRCLNRHRRRRAPQD